MNNQQRKEFHDIYISDDITKVDNIIKKFPSSLIKFYNGSYIDGQNYYLDALKSQKIWFSSPHYFNDPFDCAANVNFEDMIYQNLQKKFYRLCEKKFADELLNYKGLIGYRDWKIKKDSQIYSYNIQKLIDSVFISCFSETCNLDSLRMWGYYANSHKGFCLEYSIQNLYSMFANYEIIPIYYNNEYSFIMPKKNVTDIRRFKLALFFTKSYEWNYEKEWRLFTINNNEIGNSGFLAPFIKPIRAFLGCKIENQLKKDLLEICIQMKITPYEVYMIPNTYKLECRKIDIN